MKASQTRHITELAGNRLSYVVDQGRLPQQIQHVPFVAAGIWVRAGAVLHLPPINIPNHLPIGARRIKAKAVLRAKPAST